MCQILRDKCEINFILNLNELCIRNKNSVLVLRITDEFIPADFLGI
jgi:hypothetical protein